MPLFSIIIPVYNVRNYLRECLDSVCGQRLSDAKYEVIIVDDGSNDGSGEICEEFALQYPDIVHLIHQQNQGVSSARNIGLKEACGEYVWFVDADDWIEHGALQYLKDIVLKSNCDTVFFGSNKLPSNLDFAYSKAPVDKFLKNRYTYWVSQMLFRRSIIEANNLKFTVGMKIAEDLEFQYKYLSYVTDPISVKYSLYNLRQREGSASRNASSDMENYKGTILLLSNYCQFINERNDKDFHWMAYRIEERFKSLLQSISKSPDNNWRIVQNIFNTLYDKYITLGFKNIKNSSLRIARMSVRLYCGLLLLNTKLHCRR